MKRTIAVVYILIALALFTYGAYLVLERTRPVAATTDVASDPVTDDRIFNLTIPSAGVSLPAYTADIVGTTWQTTKRGVSYLSSSALPGQQGNSVIYGHNWPNLLGNLHEVQPGDPVYVKTQDHTYRFIVYFVTEVGPYESSVYQNTTDTRLTIYTCSGFLDSKRLVVTAMFDTQLAAESAHTYSSSR